MGLEISHDPHRLELWAKIEPYLEGRDGKLCIREDAPTDIVEAGKELYRLESEDLSQ